MPEGDRAAVGIGQRLIEAERPHDGDDLGREGLVELDDRDVAQPEAGLDSKIVLHKSLVLDTTLNPDFAQVESDDPAVTANQRFEVFFPEKRPFFQENASYFQTPINLVFTRRIADPKFGVRLSGKDGPWAIGALLADDHSPSDSVLPSDPLSGQSA